MRPGFASQLSTAFIFSAAMCLGGCGGKTSAPADEQPVVRLPVTVAAREALGGGDLASGTVDADDRVQLVARTSGAIHAPGLHEGQSVRRGQILATIDVRQADAAVQRARAALDAAAAEQRDAEGDVARDAPLAQSGALAGDAFRKEQLRAQSGRAAVEQAKAALAAADADRSYNTILSPVDGVVVARHIRDGDLAMPGAPVATVEGRGHLIFRFASPQASLAAFAPGAPATVVLDGYGNGPLVGRVRSVVPSADPATRRYTVEIELPTDPAVMAGMYGYVRLPRGGGQQAGDGLVTAPASAIADRGGLTGVFVVGQDRRVAFRWLRLGERVGGRVVVISGLAAGERILAQVDSTVRDGARVADGAAR
jgi:RND family efflux transporter MFP subunit